MNKMGGVRIYFIYAYCCHAGDCNAPCLQHDLRTHGLFCYFRSAVECAARDSFASEVGCSVFSHDERCFAF